MGNELSGARRMGCSSWSISDEHACRGLPLISIEQLPHTSSRHTLSHTTGSTFSPLALTGFLRISIRAPVTFMFGRYGMANSST